MKSLPKGVRAIRKRLADGSTTTYYDHRATGARLPSPDDPAFSGKLAEAKPGVGKYAPGTPGALTIAYRRSPEWRTKEQADFATAKLPEHRRRVVILARYTGQRRGDLCRMAWSGYDGRTIRVKQEKTGSELVLPVIPR